MATTFYPSPPRWVVDTASATAFDLASVMLDSVVWVGGATSAAGDTAVLQDKAGLPLWESVAPGADFVGDEQLFPKHMGPVNGLKCPTLAHGKLYIYLR